MDIFEEIYLTLMPVATSFGIGYAMAEGNSLKITGYSIMTAMFLGEKILRRLKENSKTLEEKL